MIHPEFSPASRTARILFTKNPLEDNDRDVRHHLPLIKQRLASPSRLPLLWAYQKHLLKKLFRAGFADSSSLEKIDIVIPTVSKDSALLEEVLFSIRKHMLHPINKVYIVSRRSGEMEAFCQKHGCVFVDELSILGYGRESIRYAVNGLDRSGWIYQQLLKFAGEKYVEMENFLVVDSDTVLINPHAFMKDGKWIFLQSSEWHEPYARSFQFLFGHPKTSRLSYTSHMMIFNTGRLGLLKQELANRHHLAWDQAFLSTIDETEISCVSEYDLYANWMLHKFPEQTLSQPFYNTALTRGGLAHEGKLHAKYGSGLKSISFHSYLST